MDARLIVAGRSRVAKAIVNRARLRKIIVNLRITFDARHVGTGRQCFGKLPVSFYQNCVNDVEGSMLDVAVPQPLQDWALGALRLLQQGLINESALFGFGWQTGRPLRSA